jgi:hypothetical protein
MGHNELYALVEPDLHTQVCVKNRRLERTMDLIIDRREKYTQTDWINRVTVSANAVGDFGLWQRCERKNSYGIGANSSAVMVRNSNVSNSAIGIAADQAAVVRVGQSTITANDTGWQATQC